MPVPETYLVRVDKGDYAAMFAQHNIQTDAVIAFGCRDVGVKSLARRYQAEGMAFKQWFVTHCSRWKRVVSFDGWIANIDRHFGNALIGGADELWLIDHGHSFTGPAWSEDKLVPNAVVPNRLVNELNDVITNEIRDAIAAEATDAQQIFELAHVEGVLEDSNASSLLSPSERQALVNFMEQRKTNVMELVGAAIGRPLLPLAGAVA